MKPSGVFFAKWIALGVAANLSAVAALAQTPIIVQQPQSQIAAVGYGAIFSVVVTNPSPFPKVQWQNNQQPISDATNSFVLTFNNQFPSGAYFANYSITNTQLTNTGNYSVTLSNSNGSTVSSNATLGVIPAYSFITMAGLAGTKGTNDGTGSAARFNLPKHVALDAKGNLYVTDFGNHTIRKVAPAGIVNTFAGTPGVAGTNDGPPDTALFNSPHGIALDKTGNIFVTDLSTNGFNGGTIRKITPDGIVATIGGVQGVAGTNDGVGSNALFGSPWGVTVDGAGDVFVSDAASDTIRKLTSPDGTNWTVTTIAGLPGVSGNIDGTNSDARFSSPDGLAVDSAGDVFVADEFNSRIRMVEPMGTNWVVTTIWWTGRNGQGPSAMAVDTNDNIYVAGQTVPVIYKLTACGTNWLATTIAGNNGVGAISDGTGIAVRFSSPHGIAVDNTGDVFVVDGVGNVRKGWSSDASPTTVLNPPLISGGQVQLNFVVTTGSPTNFTLLQADTLDGVWSINTDALLTTNIPGLYYQMTGPLANGSSEFYRLQQQ
jgi:hypothetical protein